MFLPTAEYLLSKKVTDLPLVRVRNSPAASVKIEEQGV
jgi:hypothetical protein